jgi:hypothetical protein
MFREDCNQDGCAPVDIVLPPEPGLHQGDGSESRGAEATVLGNLNRNRRAVRRGRSSWLQNFPLAVNFSAQHRQNPHPVSFSLRS